MFLRNFARNENGSVLVEATLLVPFLFVFLLGSIDFLYAFFEWNMANKAVQLGARLAAISDPVSSDLSTLTGLSDTVLPGEPMPAFTRACSSLSPTGATGTCTDGTYSQAAMRRIVFGDPQATACSDTGSGMCSLDASITPANVTITYTQTGLGYAGRPGGPVPTITVSLRNLPFRFFFLDALLRSADMTIPPMTTTTTGEHLSSRPS